MKRIIIDLEFTGLDNSYISNSEIVQVKMIDADNKKRHILRNFRSEKPIGIYGRMQSMPDYFPTQEFSAVEFDMMRNYMGEHQEMVYYGFSTRTDMEMLRKYGISLPICDIQEMIMLSEHEQTLAEQGRSMEVCYFLLTDNIYRGTHSGLDELNVIRELFLKAQQLEQREFLRYVPWGHCAGMPITDYVSMYRRNADGYRYNNSDLFAKSLDHVIDEMETYGNDFDFDDEPEY